MEHRDSHEANDELDTQASRKKRGSEFFSRYLLRRQETPLEATDNSEEDDDDEEDTSPLPKRRRRLFSKLFKRNVEYNQPAAESAGSREYGFSPEAWFTWQGAPETKQGDEPTFDTAKQPQAETNVATETTLPQNGDIIEQRLSEVDEELHMGPDTEPNIDTTDNVEPSIETTRSSNQKGGEEEIATSAHNYERQDNGAGGLLQIDQENPNDAQNPAAKSERVIEQRGSTLPYVLLGAEYFARKNADKKLDQKHSAQEKQLATKVEAGNSRSDELQKLINRNKEQLESLKRQADDREHLAQKKESVPQPAQAEKRLPVSEVMVAPSDAPESKQVLQSVAEAAEHDAPIERVFERSHEVKDDQAGSGPTGATSVGAIARAQFAPQASMINQDKAHAVLPDEPPAAFSDPELVRSMYVQAMRMGFVTGITVIVLGLISYLMIK